MIRTTLASAALALLGTASFAETCEAIRAQIDAKVRASGVQQFTLTTVDAGAKAMGKVVGSCDLGTKQIVYVQGASAATTATTTTGNPPQSMQAVTPAPRALPLPRKNAEAILTECKDGTVSMGGDCKK